MLRIAITGGIACGKSLVGSFLADEGFAVLEADRVAHKEMSPSGAAYQPLVESFGKTILGDDGWIDRPVLGAMAFGNPQVLRRLNAAVHPHVKRRIQDWLDERRLSGGSRVAFVIVPLLYEAGMETGWNAVVCVASSEKTQLRRLAERRISAGDASKRLAAQMPMQEKVRRADSVIFNNGSEELLRIQTMRVLKRILEMVE